MASDRSPSIYDVAARAGCSKSTVSRVLQDSPMVAGKTRQRVLQAIDELGYRHSPAVRLAMQEARSGRGNAAIRDLTLVAVPTAFERLGPGHLHAAKTCAVRLGYDLQARSCSADDFVRLERQLYARGGVGLIGFHFPFFVVQNFAAHHSLLMPTVNVATAANPTHKMPQIARHMGGSARLAAFHARIAGYRRVGLQYNIWDDPFHEFRAALSERLAYYGLQLFVCNQRLETGPIIQWIKEHRIECLITSEAELIKNLKEQMPELGLICGRAEELPPAVTCSGLYTDISQSIEYAVRLLIRLLEIPPLDSLEPHLHLFEPSWKEAGTLGNCPDSPSIRSISFPAPATTPGHPGKFQPVELGASANAALTGVAGLFPNLSPDACPRGLHTVCGVPFEFLDDKETGNRSIVFTRHTQGQPKVVHIPVNASADALYFLHCCTYAVRGSVIGCYHVHFEGHSREIPLVPAADPRHQTHVQTENRFNICDWWKSTPSCESENVKPVWIIQNANPLDYEGHLCVLRWKSPSPHEFITHITIEMQEEVKSQLALLALTLEIAISES